MYREDLNRNLREIINEVQELRIPVPHNISKEVIVNSRPRKRFGCCRKKSGQFNIEISEIILESPDRAIREVLAHEVLHTCNGCYDHGVLWKKYASMMNEAYGYNIKRASSFADMGLEDSVPEKKIRYIIKCQKCGKEYPRQKFTCVMKKINAYRCNCGGKLTVIKK